MVLVMRNLGYLDGVDGLGIIWTGGRCLPLPSTISLCCISLLYLSTPPRRNVRMIRLLYSSGIVGDLRTGTCGPGFLVNGSR
jgi:hypothetical protein